MEGLIADTCAPCAYVDMFTRNRSRGDNTPVKFPEHAIGNVEVPRISLLLSFSHFFTESSVLASPFRSRSTLMILASAAELIDIVGKSSLHSLSTGRTRIAGNFRSRDTGPILLRIRAPTPGSPLYSASNQCHSSLSRSVVVFIPVRDARLGRPLSGSC